MSSSRCCGLPSQSCLCHTDMSGKIDLGTWGGRTVKMLNVIDEFTREALAIEVDRSIDADGVVAVLDRLALTHGAPYYVRFDNGPEFVAHAVSDWCRFNSAGS